MTPLLEVDGLTARYGPIVAVRDASLRVDEGEIVALLGANGAGKTTTLGAIVGLVPSRTGRVELAGEDVSRLAPEALVRRGLGLVPEGRRLFGRLTVNENLAIGAATRARRRHEVARDRTRLLDLFPVLSERLDQPAGLLSGGEQQQLAIARALMARPRLLLLDEPTLGLAPKLVRTLFELIARLRDEEGVTVLLVEQNVHQALETCDRAYLIRSGRIEREGTPAELRRTTDIEQAYLGG
ncbi:MAG TPA: ABC transporter ATP-binding protein [Gaiellaceae bacterium]|jgi:branched-chain amino acid transport system ATP-binding protein|nr:ABC transporter ATP-binding protein [Gaiellaceae bacterium]